MNTQNIKIYDNGGKTFDRYTAIIDRMFFGFSENPFSPLGFSQFCGDVPKGMRSYRHLGKKVSLDSLSADVQKAILDRIDKLEIGLLKKRIAELEEQLKAKSK